MLEVKPYKPKYKEDLQIVCLNTAYSTAYEPIERNYLLNTYCDYYLDMEGEHCFAAVDENDTAQGYILCAPNFIQYLKKCRPYVKQAKKSGFDHWIEGFGERVCYTVLGLRYPAHMHIDLNPGFQRQGAGTRMVNTLLEHLRSMGVKRVMLIAGSGNEQGLNFYRKFGFKRVITLGPATVMGYDLRKG